MSARRDWDPIARPARDVDGRWTVDAWAPLSGPHDQRRHQGLVLMPSRNIMRVHALDLLDRILSPCRVTTVRVVDRAAVAQTPSAEAAPPPASAETGRKQTRCRRSSWPGFRGQDRDGVYRGAIRVSWEGLAPMWKKPIGGGRSSFAVAGGRAFTIEQRSRNEVVAAYDVMTGRELWTNAWPERFSQWMGGGEGPRATPAWADGFVFALGARGELRCLDAATGRLVWRTNILQDAGAKNLRWGMAASPLIAGDAVIVLPGGPAGDRSRPTIAGRASGCGRRSTISRPTSRRCRSRSSASRSSWSSAPSGWWV